jgi:hypothetical protein
MSRPYREWTPDDTATLRRMAGAGYSDADIARHIHRDRPQVTRKRQDMDIRPGVSPAMIAALARVNMRRRMAA